MGFVAAGKTHIGMKRKSNQDSIFLDIPKHIFIVADGMGGHKAGDLASQLAVKHVPEYLLSHLDEDPEKACRESIRHANAMIKQKSDSNEDFRGMGTTTVLFYFKGAYLYLGNVGDSRAYLINNRKLYQMTRDHSLVQEKLNLGIYTREQAAEDPHKNVLVRTVGFEPEVEVDSFTYKVHRNDIFLSCSDGLHGKVSDADILYIINSNIPDPAKASEAQVKKTVDMLVDQANQNGGNDNISVILVIAQ
ncbi:MAG: Stp1/IreP family PP2C-type Ser/Thr phosphatase [Bacteriovoracaceae bacterium]